jgi:hypothetical protein
MTAQLVPTVKTSYSPEELIKSFIEGWKKQFGTMPNKKSIAILWAQNRIETGATSAMWNNNIGNVKYVPSNNPESDNNIQYMMLSNVWEIINGKKVVFQPPHKATWFRAFPTLTDGVAFHLDFLKNHRYKKAWAAIEAGSPSNFAHLLKEAGYYTAPEEDYSKAIALFFMRFIRDDTYEKVLASLVAPKPTTIVNHVETITVETPIAPLPVEQPTSVTPIPTAVPPPNKSLWQTIIQFILGLFKRK